MSKKLPLSISEEEFSLLLRNTLKTHHKIAFLLGFEAGMRVSEVVNLKPEDLDFKGKKILIKNGKGSKDRVVPMPKSFKPRMMAHIPFKCGIRSLQRIFKRASLKANLKANLKFHSLRHGFATHLIEKGMPINQIQLLMGHENIKTTSVYLKANPIDALKSYEQYF